MSYNSPFTGQVIQPTDVSYRSIVMTASVQLSWPLNGNATDNYAARIMDVASGSTSYILSMPPADQTSVGTDALIRNVGTNAITVKTFGEYSSIVTVQPGAVQYIYVTANPNNYGTWGVIAFGTGTSSADAASLAGYGLLATSNTLSQSHPTASLTANYTFLSGDRAQTYVWGGGTTTVNLPSASVIGNNWFVLLKNNGTGTLTVDAYGSETIDNGLTKNFAPNESAFIVCTGSQFVTIGYGVSTQFAFTALVKNVTGGNYTLTASEASNTIQTYIGTLASNVLVTYPPVVNLYIVSNQCSVAGHTLTLTTGVAGGATATIPASNQATLICDGTNFYNANTTQAGGTSFSIISGTAGSPSLNFSSETTTGIFRPGAGRFGVTVLGNQIVDVNASGVTVTGSGTFTTGISGGTF